MSVVQHMKAKYVTIVTQGSEGRDGCYCEVLTQDWEWYTIT